MPTYEYKCPTCKEVIEIFHRVELMEFILCEKCNINMIKGFGGGTAIHFKGSGFYETDYKGK
jgi:putative FmdB family regulatory protein